MSLPGYVCFSTYSIKCVLCFMLRHLMMPWYLNIWKFTIWLSQEQKELAKWNKKYFSLFHKCSLLSIQNKPVKMYQTQPLSTIKWGDFDLFLIYFMISYLTATTRPFDTQNLRHCALTLLIKKTHDFWSPSFLVFLSL